MRNVKVSSPYGKGRIRQLLAHGVVCIESPPNQPKDAIETVKVTFCFGRGGRTEVDVIARARWYDNRYVAHFPSYYLP